MQMRLPTEKEWEELYKEGLVGKKYGGFMMDARLVMERMSEMQEEKNQERIDEEIDDEETPF